jgi:hypothetical protein
MSVTDANRQLAMRKSNWETNLTLDAAVASAAAAGLTIRLLLHSTSHFLRQLKREVQKYLSQ